MKKDIDAKDDFSNYKYYNDDRNEYEKVLTTRLARSLSELNLQMLSTHQIKSTS
jgi:hypothetical protein